MGMVDPMNAQDMLDHALGQLEGPAREQARAGARRRSRPGRDVRPPRPGDRPAARRRPDDRAARRPGEPHARLRVRESPTAAEHPRLRAGDRPVPLGGRRRRRLHPPRRPAHPAAGDPSLEGPDEPGGLRLQPPAAGPGAGAVRPSARAIPTAARTVPRRRRAPSRRCCTTPACSTTSPPSIVPATGRAARSPLPDLQALCELKANDPGRYQQAPLLGLRLPRRLPRRSGRPGASARRPPARRTSRCSPISRPTRRTSGASCPATARTTAAAARTSSSPTCHVGWHNTRRLGPHDSDMFLNDVAATRPRPPRCSTPSSCPASSRSRRAGVKGLRRTRFEPPPIGRPPDRPLSRSQSRSASIVLASSIRPSWTIRSASSQATTTGLSRSSAWWSVGPGLEVLAEEEEHPLAHHPGRDEPFADPDDPPGAVAGLLGQLARGGLLGGLAGIDRPGGDFQQDLATA